MSNIEDIDSSPCDPLSSTGNFTTQANLVIGDPSELAMDLDSAELTATEENHTCVECWKLYFAGFETPECCDEEYTGCVSSLSITNESSTTIIDGGMYIIDLTFDYDVILNHEVTVDSYIKMEISSESWTSTISTAIFVSSGSDTASGTETVSLTDVAEPSCTSIKIKFNTR